MKLLIVNGSPRAPRSNSRRYAELFQARWKGEARYAALTAKNHAELAVTMPLSPRSFVRASTRYWTQMGAANGCTPEQMASMDIEPQP